MLVSLPVHVLVPVSVLTLGDLGDVDDARAAAAVLDDPGDVDDARAVAAALGDTDDVVAIAHAGGIAPLIAQVREDAPDAQEEAAGALWKLVGHLVTLNELRAGGWRGAESAKGAAPRSPPGERRSWRIHVLYCVAFGGI